MIQIFRNNLLALQNHNPELSDALSQISTNTRYDAFQAGQQPVEINILDTYRQVNMYQDPLNDLSTEISRMDEYINYNFLYYFGIGNGYLIRSILMRHEKLKRFVVIEPEIELLYIALHLNDFSGDILSGRVQLYHTAQCTPALFEKMFYEHKSALFIRTTGLYAPAYYAEHFDTEYRQVFQTFQHTLNYIVKTLGNDLEDEFTGVKQILGHLHLLRNAPSLEELKRKKNSDMAIIVSTGPSLTKQLPLLKEIAPYVTVISVDASLPILEIHDIKPDICASIERDEPTSEFFKRTSPEFRKGIIFVCPLLQHPSVFTTLADDIVIPVFKPNFNQRILGIDDYGYLGKGHSAANLAQDIAYEMGFKQCVFIGQDLSFAADGETTHAEGHVFESDPDIAREVEEGNLFDIPAYGGKGTVKTHMYWQLFRDSIVRSSLAYAPQMVTINATNGGAYIEGTVEKPFSEVVALGKTEFPLKAPIVLTPPTRKKNEKNLHYLDKKVNSLAAEGRRTLKRLISLQQKLNTVLSTPASHNETDLEETLNLINTEYMNMSSSELFDGFYLTTLISSYFVKQLDNVEVSQKKFSDKISHNIALIHTYVPLIEAIIEGTKKLVTILETYPQTMRKA